MFLHKGNGYYVRKPSVPKLLMCPVEWRKYRNKLVEANTELVKWQINRCFQRWLTLNKDYHNRFDELVGEGNAALLRAATVYDWGRGTEFSTYAADVIWKELVRYINKQRRYIPTQTINEVYDSPQVDTIGESVDRENDRNYLLTKLEELKAYLSKNQLRILGLILTKTKHKVIARELGVSPTTVNNYVHAIKKTARGLVS